MNGKYFGRVYEDVNEDAKEVVFKTNAGGMIDDLFAFALQQAPMVHAEGWKAYVYWKNEDVTFEIKPEMKEIKDVWNAYNIAEAERRKQKEREYEEWLKTPEGIVYQKKQEEERKKQEEEKREYDKWIFHSYEEFVDALKQIKPCDLTSETSSKCDALKMCKEVILAINKAGALRFSDEQKNNISNILKCLGCCKTNEAAEKFIELPNNASIGDAMRAENNIEFPLSVFNNLIDVSPSNFGFSMSYVTDGGKKYSWCAEWLETQEKTKANPEKE